MTFKGYRKHITRPGSLCAAVLAAVPMLWMLLHPDAADARVRLENYYETEAVAENDNSLQRGTRWVIHPVKHL